MKKLLLILFVSILGIVLYAQNRDCNRYTVSVNVTSETLTLSPNATVSCYFTFNENGVISIVTISKPYVGPGTYTFNSGKQCNFNSIIWSYEVVGHNGAYCFDEVYTPANNIWWPTVNQTLTYHCSYL